MTRLTLSKQERLSSRKDIETLFERGQSLAKYPVRLVWMKCQDMGDYPVSVMFSVSKKKFSKAVDRNRIKRLLRENYRLLKPSLYQALPGDTTILLGILFTGTDLPSFDDIQKGLNMALERLITLIRKE